MKSRHFIISISIMLLCSAICVGCSAFFQPGGFIEKIQYEKRADEIISGMTTEEKVGQMFIGCFYSGTPSAETVNRYELGGVLLFGPSFESSAKSELTAKLAAIQGVCDLPPIIAVDEEGGDVVRVSADKKYRSKPFDSPRSIYKRGGIEAILDDTHEKNALLSDIGINMNLAPVCDISTNPDDFMYSRSLGENADITADYAATVTSACVEDGMGCALKHFPGYGNAVDTHTGTAVDKRPLEKIMSEDLMPFEAGINAGAHCVLVSHNTILSIDKTKPASLSPSVNDLLRETLAFDGVIMTDDLIMGAVTEYGSPSEIAVAAVLAGNDMLCTGDYKEQIQAVLDAIDEGKISEERIDASVKRILMLKLELGIIS